ncbi:MAG: response regulator [Actinomycetota bacterium]|nr:response regulator [Actinomycetota bacterium]
MTESTGEIRSPTAGSGSVMGALRAVRRLLPEGGKLPDKEWRTRHVLIVGLLWLHVPAVMLFGLAVGAGAPHVIVEAVPIAAAAAIATYLRRCRTVSTVVTSLGLMTSSGVIVHLSGGVIEAHFHFFVMVGVVVLYQEWWPYLVAIGYVVLHHGVLGTLFPHDVYNHPAAVNSPWKWAGVHGAFILAMSIAGVLSWRLNETLHATTALREQQLAEAQHLAHVGSWEWDVGTGNIEWSDEQYRLMGLEPGSVRPTLESFMERVHPEDAPRLTRAIEAALESNRHFAIDFRITTPGGDVRWMHGRGEAVAAEGGRPTRMRGTGHDITEQKRMQAALVKEAVLLRGLLQTVAVAANEATTVNGAIQVAIEQICAFTGWPVGHASLSNEPGEPFTSMGIWHLDDPHRFDAFRRATEETSLPPGVGLWRSVVTSGAPTWILDVATDPVFARSEAARQSGIVSAFALPLSVGKQATALLEFFSTKSEPVDDQLLEVMTQVGKQLGLVVEKIGAFEKLQASNERNRTIVETASDAFVEMDERGLIADWNRSAEAMFGWTRDEVVGRELAAVIIPEELRSAHREGLRHYLATGEGRAMSDRLRVDAIRKNGARFPVEVALWEVRSETSRSFNAFVRDTSQQKATEDALASARDQALEASRMKSEFLANMSHEIRTPMNAVIGLTGLLLDTDLDETQRRYADGARSAGEGLLSIINGILDFSKIEAGKIELEQVDLDLRDVVEESVGLLAGAAAAKGIDLAAWCYPNLPTAVQGDPVRLRQILLNLVGNAVKFTEQGQVVVQARPLEVDDASVVARFDVIDTGIGIDAASYDRLFVSFSQADTSTTRRYGGTGLGLALVKRLVDLMGGEVGVESEPGRGSTFWFSVRLARCPEATPPPVLPPSLAGVRALVVDDNATNCLILGQQLAAWGVRPDTAQDAHHALELLRSAAEAGDRYGVAVVDMQMPGTDGLGLAEAITADPTVAGIPVIVLSSAGSVAAAPRAEAGIAASLMKPVRQSDLHDALVRALAPAPPEPAVVDREHAAPPKPAGQRGRVLVVEDNEINQMVAVGTLTKLGYQTDVAANGREAVDAVSGRRYAAVLMDCQMPEMDGFEAARAIRRREGGDRHVPIIAMTASATDADRQRCIAAGMDDYIAKPVRIERIEAVLEHWTSAGDGRPPSGDGPVPDEDVLDPSLVDQLRELGPDDDGADLFPKLVETFAREGATRVSELRDAAQSEDFACLVRVAHTQRGSSAMMGAGALASACGALESASRQSDIEEARARLQAVEAELERATAALRSEAHLR